MEVKKTPKADLENKKTIFLEVGLAIALLVVLLAFEWTSSEAAISVDQSQIAGVKMEEEIVPITNQEEIKPPEPPKVKSVAEIIKVVEDNVDVADNADIFDSDFDENAAVDVVIFNETDDEKEVVEEEVFQIVEDMPTYGNGGGLEEFRKDVQNAARYPDAAAENNIQGKVYLSFVVNEKGEVTNIKVQRGVDPLLDNAAVKAVQSIKKKWKPGKQRGKPAKVMFSMPLVFILQ
ncbi:MAG: TonB family protein [Bacteroidales bacterium]|nr:TonB family protein [Bacteroidales bacterium]